MNKLTDIAQRYSNRPEALKALDEGKRVRFCALNHEALGLTRTKVLFHDKEGVEYGYWMNPETYDAIPLGVVATLEDYIRVGEVVESANAEIYDCEHN